MIRTERLVVRLSKSEREEIDALAQDKRLPASTMARAILLREAAARASGEKAMQRAR